MNGTKAQKAYSSHMWPKYPNAAARKSFDLKTCGKTRRLKPVPLEINGPSGTSKNIDKPPKTAIMETVTITTIQFKSPPILFSQWGNAVPKTKAPTKKPMALPKPFWYQPAAIFIPIG